MSSVSARLEQVIDSLGIVQSKFAEETGLSKQTLHSTIKRKAQLKTDVLEKIANAYPNINLEWLILGQGNMWKEKVRDKDKTKEELLLKIKSLEDKIKVLSYTLGTKENMIANRGRRIEQLEEHVATLQFRIQQLEEDQ